MAKGSCLSTTLLLNIAYLYSALTIVVDFSLGFMPIVLVWNLQMNRRTKFAVGGILSLGAMYVDPSNNANTTANNFQCEYCSGYSTSVSSLLYRYGFSLYVIFSSMDISHTNLSDLDSTYQIAIWSILETSLGIIAGSLATLRPLFRWFLDGSLYGKNKRYERSASARYPLASLKGEGNGTKLSNDPRYWRPDIDETKVITSVSSPRDPGFPPSNSSEEHLYPNSGGVRNPYHVSVQETITVEAVTHTRSSSTS